MEVQNMNTTMIVAGVLGVLIILSAVQAYQLSSLKGTLEDGQMTVKSQSGKTSVAQSGDTQQKSSNLPASIKELPQMVGGC